VTEHSYYTLSFVYHVSRKGISESWEEFFKVDCENKAGLIASPAESDAANYVETFVEAFLTGAGVEFRHAYSWPDGSCYKNIRIDAEQNIGELVKLLSSRLEGAAMYRLQIGGWTPVDRETDGLGKTVEEEFAQPSP